MNSRYGTALWVLTLLLFATGVPATAGFVGNTVSVDYDWPKLGTVLYSGGSAIVVQSGTHFAVGGGLAAVVTDTSVQVSFPKGWLFNKQTPKTFDGWVVTDLQANITGASLTASNVSGFTVTFDSTHVYISDLVSSQYPAGAFITVSVSFGRAAATSLPGATVGVPYSVYAGQGLSQIPAGANIQLAAGSNLPPGLTLSAGGLLSGTPTQAGNFTFGIAYQGGGQVGTVQLSLTVTGNSGPAIGVSPSALSFSATQGSTSAVTQSIVITNNGSSAQTFTDTAMPGSGGNWLSVSPSSGTVAPYSSTSISVSMNPSGLGVGTNTGTISISVSPANQQFSVGVLATVSSGQAQLQISQSGLRFQTIEDAGEPQTQSVTVINSGSGSLDYSVSTSTTSGGSQWLSVSPASGTVTALNSANVVVSIHSENLDDGTYYGQIQFSADGAINSPQTISVVLNVAAAGTDLGAFIYPYGLIFVGSAGGTAPPAQAFSVTNPSTSNLTFSASSLFSQGNNWFTVQPANGVVNASNPGQISVQPALAGLAPGVYPGEVVLNFAEDKTTKHIAVLLIVIPAAASRNSHAAASAACTPTKLLPVFLQLGANFTTVAAWPTPIAVTVVDDCGNFLNSGNVTASFSDGDPALPLTSLNDGNWSATWQPRSSSAQAVVTVDAAELLPPLTGAAMIGGSLQANPTTPSINAGGVVSAAEYSKNQPLAPGAFVSIYGVHLSAGQNPALSLPLATQLGATQVVLGGRALPLQFANDGQVNAVIPYDVPANSTQQLIVSNGPALSVPEPVVVAPAQPAVFAQGDGSGVVFGVKAGSSQQILVDAAHPVSAGDALVIYCAGLGPVNPPVEAGAAAPVAPSAETTNPVTVTVGGKTAQVFFGGLVGGFAGLYQVNAYVPKGVAAGNKVPLIIGVAGFKSAPVTIAVK